jgi:uncharacterized protein YkwD
MKRRWAAALAALLVTVLTGSVRFGVAIESDTLDEFAYLPVVIRSPTCQLNEYETRIAELMQTHPEQQRASLTCDPILAQVARERAVDMATRNYFDHTNPDGFGPNYLVRQAGYPLPSWYDTAPNANNVESIAAGYSTPDAAWQGWMGSTPHRTHLLGLDPFWAAQIEYGIGYAYNPASDYDHYWVVITAYKEP